MEIILKKIEDAIQKIQDNAIEGTKGLDRVEVKEHMVFWELGLLIKEFLDFKSIPESDIEDALDINFRTLEKKIRSVGTRKGKTSLPSWKYKNQTVKPPRMQEPAETWTLLGWKFVDAYQDLERWNQVAQLSGAMFKEGFVRKRAEDLIYYFQKKKPPPNAKKFQDKFIKEISKFKTNPSRKELGLDSGSKGLLHEIFGESKIQFNLIQSNLSEIRRQVNEILEKESKTHDARQNFASYIGDKPITSLRQLLRLISIDDEEKFQNRRKKFKNIPKTIKTDFFEMKELYELLYPLIDNMSLRKELFTRIKKHSLLMLNTTLFAIATSEGFEEYQENQESRKNLFS